MLGWAFLAAMTAPELTFTTFYGVSRNTRRWWDLTAGEKLGFRPQDDAEPHAAHLASGDGGADGPQGGGCAAAAYTAGRQRAPGA